MSSSPICLCSHGNSCPTSETKGSFYLKNPVEHFRWRSNLIYERIFSMHLHLQPLFDFEEKQAALGNAWWSCESAKGCSLCLLPYIFCYLVVCLSSPRFFHTMQRSSSAQILKPSQAQFDISTLHLSPLVSAMTFRLHNTAYCHPH